MNLLGGGSSEQASWKYRLGRLWKRGGLKTSPLIVAFARPRIQLQRRILASPDCPAWRCDTSSPIRTNPRRHARPPQRSDPPHRHIRTMQITAHYQEPLSVRRRCCHRTLFLPRVFETNYSWLEASVRCHRSYSGWLNLVAEWAARAKAQGRTIRHITTLTSFDTSSSPMMCRTISINSSHSRAGKAAVCLHDVARTQIGRRGF